MIHKYIHYMALASCLLFLFTGSLHAEESPPAPVMESEEDLGEEITIIKREDETIEEYRINGQLYKIKITPRKGNAYYLVDTNGDGHFDAHYSGLIEDILIPQWTLFEW